MKLPSVVDGSEPSRILIWVLAIPALSMLLTLIIPAIVAQSGSVFYRSDLVKKLSLPVQETLNDYERTRAHIDDQIAKLDKLLELPEGLSPSSIDSFILLRNSLTERRSTLTSPVSPIAFYLNPQMLLWPAIYTCLGWLITIFRPVRNWSVIRRKKITWASLTVLTYTVYEWPLWVRNFLLSTDGRTVYAYPNADIHVASFITQEIVIFGFCSLLVALWLHWGEAFKRSATEVRRSSADSFGYVVSSKTLDGLSKAFLSWQLSSVILAVGFLFFTNLFWELVAKYHDVRYLLSAVMAHLLWAVSWCMLSLPLFVRWRAWVHAKNLALARTSDQELARLGDASREKLLEKMQPLSGFGVSISGIAAITSFVLPLVQLFL